jgi:hypothetical protein
VKYFWLAAGSLNFGPKTEYQYDPTTGIYTETVIYGVTKNIHSQVKGKRDNDGRWYGQIETIIQGHGTKYIEICNWKDGERHGRSDLKHYCDDKLISERSDAYVNGVRIGRLDKSARVPAGTPSAFSLLEDEYPWFLYALYGCDLDSGYVKACTDTLETLLGAEAFAEAEFNSRYDAVVDILEETPYDTLLSINSDMFFIRGLEKLKHNEFRLAVLEHARHPEQSTYSIVTAIYPNYLHFLADSGVTNQDFEQFCLDVEDSLASYVPLVPSDPFFTDSVDAYLFRAVFGMLEGTLSASAVATESLKATVTTGTLTAAIASGIRRTRCDSALPASQVLHLLATSPEVAAVVASDMMNSDFIRGDILRAAVKKAWLMKKGTVVFPTIVTEFPEYHSDTSVDVKGYLTWDGGAPVTARGIVWAEYDDPTTSDHTLAAGSGTGDFSVTLGGLEKGKSYYVRSYAVNSEGTAYGNCVKFVASLPSGSEVPALAPGELSVFPNPSSGKVTLRFSLEAPTTVGLRVTDMAGREVMRRQASRLPQGLNQMTLDLSPLTDGVYICRLNCGSESLVRRIVIDR